MSLYFTLPSFARAKKHQEELQKSNPQNPVLKDDDERWLEKQISQDNQTSPPEDEPVTAITDDGDVKPASPAEQAAATDPIVPELQPEPSVGSTKPEKTKQKEIELPSQEEAERLTKSWNSTVKQDDKEAGEKRTWASYIPQAVRPSSGKRPESSDSARPDTRSWKEFAASYVPSKESIPAWLDPTTWIPKDPDAKAEPVLNDDGSINEEKTKEKEEKEISVLLDNLSLASINNRVFAFNEETRKFYDRFAQCLKDTMNGVPTAYDDMEKLMKEAGPTLEKQFKSMPPFVQTLVKSLPAKLGTTLAPELLAAASEKPGADAKVLAEASGKGGKKAEEKKSRKRKIPGLKKLVSSQGVVATMLRNTVNFLTTRFPFLASATNVVMSLAVFILMFVFWYCHKRGRETRLAREADAAAATDGTAEKQAADEDDEDNDVSDDDDEDEATVKRMEELLNQPNPSQVPLPKSDTGLEEEK